MRHKKNKVDGEGTDNFLCFKQAIDRIVREQRELPNPPDVLVDNRCVVWQYLVPYFDPEKCPCTYTCVWKAFETFYDSQCSQLSHEEDKTNACVKWLHQLDTNIHNLEAADDLISTHPYAEYRDRFTQLRRRIDEISEFVMHKFRCAKFGL